MIKSTTIFEKDYNATLNEFIYIINNSRFLVLGGAGSIGQEVVKILFRNSPQKLHIVDISENNLVELVRDLRSSYGYIDGDFKTFSLDISSKEYDQFIEQDGNYDYVLNLSALKHVRSEKDPFTIVRLINTNILNVEKTINQSINKGIRNYFSVSTDKAANPVNIMGASKRLMELIMFQHSDNITVTSSRFANVLYSDGSLLHSFNQRILKKQPIVAPSDIKRYFISKFDAAILCLMACFFGNNREIYYPKLSKYKDLKTFKELALEFLNTKNLEPIFCNNEDEARKLSRKLTGSHWPCFFSESETTGEKPFEEFFSENDEIDNDRYRKIGIIKNEKKLNFENLKYFKSNLEVFISGNNWLRADLVKIFKQVLKEYSPIETGKFLDDKM